MVHIRQVDPARKREVRQFVDFSAELYRGNAQWVPPMWAEMERVLDPRSHPFYRHSAAAFYLAEGAGRTLGRLAVLENTLYNQAHGTREAFFHYLETVNDLAVTRALFAAAFDWARQRGLTSISGPRGLNSSEGKGVLVEGFEHRPALGIPYNYPYYHPLIADAGFAKESDTFSGYLSGEHQLAERFYEIAEKVKTRRGIRIKSFSSRAELRSWFGRIGQLVNQSFAEHYDATPMTPEEVSLAGENLSAVADPRLIKLVMKGDEIIGFLFAFHDVSAALQRTGGRLWPLGWLDLLLEFRRTRWLNINGVGLLPDHQGVGANAVLYTELVRSLRGFHFAHADVVQVGEQNIKSLGDMSAIGVRWYKRHRLYRREL